MIEIGSKTAEKNSAQTNRQTNRHYENNGHLAVNQKYHNSIDYETTPIASARLFAAVSALSYSREQKPKGIQSLNFGNQLKYNKLFSVPRRTFSPYGNPLTVFENSCYENDAQAKRKLYHLIIS